MDFSKIYDSRKNTIFGIPINYVLIGVVLFLLLTNIKNFLALPIKIWNDLSGGIGNLFGKDPAEQKRDEERLKEEEKAVNTAKNYGSPTADDIVKSNMLFNALNSHFGNDKKVIEIFGTITGRTQMNRIYSHFGIRKISYDFLWSKSYNGHLIGHITASKIDPNEWHKRVDGSTYTIQMMLNHIGK